VVNGSTSLGGAGSAAGGAASAWALTLPIYGPERVVRAQMEYCRDKFAKIAGSTFTEGELFRTPLSADALTRMRETIKDALDPNGILSPGRHGIWPRHLRKG
jgi:FAD/FMN-containing dehydrogenase